MPTKHGPAPQYHKDRIFQLPSRVLHQLRFVKFAGGVPIGIVSYDNLWQSSDSRWNVSVPLIVPCEPVWAFCQLVEAPLARAGRLSRPLAASTIIPKSALFNES